MKGRCWRAMCLYQKNPSRPGCSVHGVLSNQIWPQEYSPMQQNDPATLKDVIAGLCRAKISITAGVLLGLALAALFLASAVPFYRAQMIVGPATPIIYDERASAA